MFNNPLNFTDPEGEIIAPLIVAAAAVPVLGVAAAFSILPCMQKCIKARENQSNSKPKVPPNFPGGNPSCPPDNPDPPEDDPMQPRKDNQNFAICLKGCIKGVLAFAGAADPFGTGASMAGSAVGEAIGGGTIE